MLFEFFNWISLHYLLCLHYSVHLSFLMYKDACALLPSIADLLLYVSEFSPRNLILNILLSGTALYLLGLLLLHIEELIYQSGLSQCFISFAEYELQI